ncbi:MAG: glycosyltransferase family 2 protein [Candidatus Dadabacteria bacterium]|nr:MAG: glycosyltransferase family 2 protein [Candidatus Dadabacteria bacterium]
MYRERKIAVVIPAYNEEKLIQYTISSVPDFVDHIVVINDASQDRTGEKVIEVGQQDRRIHYIEHKQNRGVGAAISSGYIWCRENDIDIAVVMAGDGQMDPADLPALLDPVVEDRTDYAKGNRLVTGEAWQKIPRVRYLGNSVLTFLTKIASGYWHVTDSQTGYTALNKKALKVLPLENIYPRYGMPNDFLVTLNIYNMRVMDVPVNPVYGIGEKSGIKITKVIFSLSFLIMRLFMKRMVQKYIIRDFHPLILFYAFGAFLLLVDIPLIIRLFWKWAETGIIPSINALTVVFCTFMAFQSILFAMLFDMEANRDLKGG